MDINNINANTSAAFSQQGARRSGDLGQQEFLQLLVAQMRNQDPINPLDGAEFASQLAQFNSVEQLINVNSSISKLQESHNVMSSSLTNSMAVSLTGKQVRAIGDQVHLASGQSAGIQYKLADSATEVEIVIRNSSGAEVRREVIQGAPSGENGWVWDGRNHAGDRMSDGNYQVEINAKNGNGKVNSLSYLEGVASKVRYSGRGVYLTVNNVEIPISDIEEVGIDLF